ncbi:hypothetical protein LEMLEM_LOCUS19121, partial [Lemmus lemmus]
SPKEAASASPYFSPPPLFSFSPFPSIIHLINTQPHSAWCAYPCLCPSPPAVCFPAQAEPPWETCSVVTWHAHLSVSPCGLLQPLTELRHPCLGPGCSQNLLPAATWPTCCHSGTYSVSATAATRDPGILQHFYLIHFRSHQMGS